MYRYTSLVDPTRQIRLLQLSGITDDRISCTMQIVDAPWKEKDFVAISYTWKPEQPRHIISIDGDLFEIGHNLWTFLLTLLRTKDFNTKQKMWIDQICIDQASGGTREGSGPISQPSEKDIQVQNMGKIFREASAVWAWLGYGTESTKTAVDYIAEAGQMTAPRDVSLLESQALNEVFARPFWTRLWIVQELSNASSVMFYYGDARFSRDEMLHLVHYQRDIADTFAPRRGPGYHIPDHVCELVASHVCLSPKSESISELVVRFRRLECGNMHDKVYALLGLQDFEIPVSYGSSLEQLVVEVLRYESQRKTSWQSQSGRSEMIYSASCLSEVLRVIADEAACELMVYLALNSVTPQVLRGGLLNSNREIVALCIEELRKRVGEDFDIMDCV